MSVWVIPFHESTKRTDTNERTRERAHFYGMSVWVIPFSGLCSSSESTRLHDFNACTRLVFIFLCTVLYVQYKLCVRRLLLLQQTSVVVRAGANSPGIGWGEKTIRSARSDARTFLSIGLVAFSGKPIKGTGQQCSAVQ